MTCPQTVLLADYALGKLPDGEGDMLARHIDSCPECSTVIESLDRAADTLVSRLAGEPAVSEVGGDSNYLRAAERVKQIGRELSQVSKGAPSAEIDAPAALLGQLREYQLLAKLGQGGMGAVYKARHTKLDKIVALKVLPDDRMRSAEAVSRFEREMRAVGKLDHPHIVRATDAGEVDGTHFLVMEYVRGTDLSDLVSKHGPLPVADACEMIRQAAIGLEHAFEHGMVHRDIKPSNLMLADGCVVKILDLGLALLDSQSADGGRELTGTGQLMGTADYMAPEQATDTHRVDIRADIYSLGATLYKLLTGVAPYSGERYATPISKVMAHATQPAPPIRERRPEAPEELEAVLLKMLAKSPEDRYATPLELAEALAPFAAGAELAALVGAPGDAAAAKAERSRVSTSKGPLSERSGTDTTLARSQVAKAQEAKAPAPAIAARTSLAARKQKSNHRGLLIGLAAGLATAALALAVVLSLRTPHGEVIVELDEGVDPQDVAISIKSGGKELDVADAKEGWTIRVREGKYEADLKSGSDKFALADHSVQVRRGDVTRVRVTLRLPGDPVPLRTAPAVAANTLPKPAATSAVQRVSLTPPPLVAEGEPLNSAALVARPAKLPGLRSWSVETIGHRNFDIRTAFSPDGRWLATGGRDSVVHIWDVAGGKLSRLLIGSGQPVSSLSWAPDSTRLAVARGTAALVSVSTEIWDRFQGRLLLILPGGSTVSWSPKGGVLADNGMGLYLTDLTTGVRKQAFSEKTACQYGAFWSPDGNQLACRHTGATPFTLHVLGNNTPLLPPTAVSSFCWSSDSRLFAYHGIDSLRILDTTSGELRQEWKLSSTIRGSSLSFIAEGTILALAYQSVAKCVFLRWEVASGKELPPLSVGFSGTPLCFSPDGNYLALADEGTLFIADLEEGKRDSKQRGYPGSIRGPAIASTGSSVAVQIQFGASHERDFRTAVFSAPFFDQPRWVDQGSVGEWSPDDARLAVRKSHQFVLVSADPSQPQREISVPGLSASSSPTPRWSPDGRWLAASCTGNKFVLVEADGQRRVELNGENPQLTAAAWSPEGKRLALGSETGSVSLWDTATGERLHQLAGHSGEIKSLVWSPDGKLLASSDSGSNNSQALVWDAQNGTRLALPLKGNSVQVFAFSPNSRLLVAGSRVLDWATDRTVLTAGGQHVEARFSADGRFLTSVHSKLIMERWDVSLGKLLSSVQPHNSAINSTYGSVNLAGDVGVATRELTMHLWQAGTGAPLSSVVFLDKSLLYLSPDGHYRGPEGIEQELVYVALTDDGRQLTLTPVEFSQQYGWKNDPAQVRLAAGASSPEQTPPGSTEK